MKPIYTGDIIEVTVPAGHTIQALMATDDSMLDGLADYIPLPEFRYKGKDNSMADYAKARVVGHYDDNVFKSKLKDDRFFINLLARGYM